MPEDKDQDMEKDEDKDEDTDGGGKSNASPANVQKYLKGVEYPASKEDLIESAEENEAPEEVMSKIESLEGDSFGGPQDVMKALGKS